ncbi:MAG: response regulator transcription factor [Eggerthellaceae bacterium]|nr:response regulator transcription factor [Eggerthellaceae bacterium]
MRILVVEDDIALARALEQVLRHNGYEAESVHNGQDGLDWAASGIYDVIVLDVMLPKMNGFEVVASLRRKNISTPVLMLTARDQVRDKITGLDSGADDYMTKPFEPAELLAHIRALTRRQGEVIFEKLTFSDLSLDLKSYDLSCDNKSIHLSFKEFGIMKTFMSNPRQTISKELLIDRVWGSDSTAEDNNVESYIRFVRKKLDFLGSDAHIETLRKAGYRLVETVKDIDGNDLETSPAQADGDADA